jgi:hypothetical protein
MTPRRSWILLAAAAWTFYVWGTRLVLMWGGDESGAFKVVHTLLAAVSLGFAVAIARIGWTTLRDARRKSREPELV